MELINLTQAYFKSILDYNPETGILTWKYRPSMPNNWNRRYEGTTAGSIHKKDGYVRVIINKKVITGHKLIYFMYHGIWPTRVDHENHIRHDNRILNLKNVTHAENSKNHKKHKNNTSGVNGVHFESSTGKWVAKLGIDYKSKNLGRFANIEDAIKARQSAEQTHNFHRNHGQ